MTAVADAGAGTESETRRWPRTRLGALCVVYALLSLWALVMSFFGTVMFVLGRLPAPVWTFGALSAAGFKLITLGPALVVLASRGRSVLAARALVVGQLVWLAVDLVAPEEPAAPGEVLVRAAVSLVMWVGPWLLLSDQPSRLWRDPPRGHRPLLALAFVVGLASLPWAWVNAHLDPTIRTSLGTSAELRYDVVGVPVAIVVALVVSAFCAAGWWHRGLALVLVWVAFAAVISPAGYGSPGYAGALLVVVAGLLLWATRAAQRHP